MIWSVILILEALHTMKELGNFRKTFWPFFMIALGVFLLVKSELSRGATATPAAQSGLKLPVNIHSASIGGSYVTPIGSEYETFRNDFGIFLNAQLRANDIFGEQLFPRVSFQYKSYSIIRVEDIDMRQFNFLVGLAYIPKSDALIQPFFSGDVGSMYSWLDYPKSNDTTTNARATLLTQFRPGFSANLTKQFGAEFATPFNYGWNTLRFITWGVEIGLLWRP